MNDRYLFKAKDIDTGKWVKGYYAYYPNGFGSEVREDHIIRDTIKGIMRFIDPTTLCQCTGLKDKNGNLIWENDTVKIAVIPNYLTIERDDETASYLMVNRIGIQFTLVLAWDNVKDELEVVGNAFDNPELLEEKLNDNTRSN